MNFAFDIDGTITAHPKEFKVIMKALLSQGHKVFVLTGALATNVVGGNEAWRRAQLQSVDISPDCYTDLAICVRPTFEEVGKLKGVFCKEYDINMIWEDTGIFIQGIKQESPATATMAVV